MKKLLLVLLVAALASFLLAGCFGIPDGTEGEGEGEGEAEICPAVAITSQVEVDGKTYIKGGEQTITVTFAVATEPVSVYVGAALKDMPTDAVEVVMYPDADKLVYTGTYDFGSISSATCGEAYIYVETCDSCAACKYPYTVDTVAPYGTVEVCIDACTCDGCELSFSSVTSEVACDDDELLCGDDCSGFASWSIDIYDEDPFDACCETPCVEPVESDSGACPVNFTTSCLEDDVNPAYVVVTLVDNVGNSTKFGATLTFNPNTCDTIDLVTWPADDCVDTPSFVLCDDLLD